MAAPTSFTGLLTMAARVWVLIRWQTHEWATYTTMSSKRRKKAAEQRKKTCLPLWSFHGPSCRLSMFEPYLLVAFTSCMSEDVCTCWMSTCGWGESDKGSPKTTAAQLAAPRTLGQDLPEPFKPGREMSNLTSVALIDCKRCTMISEWLEPNQFPRRFRDWSCSPAGSKVSTPVVPKPFSERSKVLKGSCDRERTRAAKPAGPSPFPPSKSVCNWGVHCKNSPKKLAPSRHSAFMERSRVNKFLNGRDTSVSQRNFRGAAPGPVRPHCLSISDDSPVAPSRKHPIGCMTSARGTNSTEKVSTSQWLACVASALKMGEASKFWASWRVPSSRAQRGLSKKNVGVQLVKQLEKSQQIHPNLRPGILAILAAFLHISSLHPQLLHWCPPQ